MVGEVRSSNYGGIEKILLLSIDGNENKRPSGLQSKGFFIRKGITNPAVVVNGKEITVLARLIFEDANGNNSAIIKYDGIYENSGPVIFPETERTLFPPEGPFGGRGVEDFRVGRLAGEIPYHGFLVHHNGRDTRTEYLRTTKQDPFNLMNWDRFGIWFPNLMVSEAIALVKNPTYKEEWQRAHGSQNHLGTKDCS